MICAYNSLMEPPDLGDASDGKTILDKSLVVPGTLLELRGSHSNGTSPFPGISNDKNCSHCSCPFIPPSSSTSAALYVCSISRRREFVKCFCYEFCRLRKTRMCSIVERCLTTSGCLLRFVSLHERQAGTQFVTVVAPLSVTGMKCSNT